MWMRLVVSLAILLQIRSALCYNNPTVAVFGSSNDATTGSSVRARGVIEAQGGFRTPAGGSIQSGMSDLGEYVAVAGKAHEYEQGDVLVIGVQPNKFTKSLKPFDPKVAGIVTTTAGYIGGVTEQGLPPTSSHVVMALVGQLQAKVSTEQGIVKMVIFLPHRLPRYFNEMLT